MVRGRIIGFASAILLLGGFLTLAAPSKKQVSSSVNLNPSVKQTTIAFPPLPTSSANILTEWDDDNWCGTTRDGAQKALEEHTRRQALLPQRAQRFTLSATGTADRGNIAVIEDDGFLLADFGQGLELDDVLACKRFYDTHPDSFDIVAIYTTADVNLGGAFAYERNISNEVSGIGLGIFDYSAGFGSAGRLRSQLNMNTINVYPPSPRSRFLRTDHHLSIMGQEAGHRWGAFVRFDSAQGPSVVPSTELLLCDEAHWSFYSDARSQFFNTSSSLEGNLWQDNGGGTYTSATVKDYYMRLDQYLIGLRSASSVDSLWLIRNPSPSNLSCNRATENPVNVSGTKVWVKIDDVVAVEGPRLPDASTAQKDFRMAFILVVPNGVKPTAYELARLDSARAQWAAYFQTAVENLGTMNTDLTSPGPIEIVSDTLVEGAVGGNYRDQVFAVGGQLPYVSYALTGGGLPPGLLLNTTTGVISGLPLTPGGYDFTVEVCDSDGACTSQQLHIDIIAVGIGTVVINEVELTSRGGSVELYNKGPQAQNIGNWMVETRTLSTLATLTIPAGTIIPPGCYFVLNEYAGTNTANYLYFNTAIPWTNAASGSCALKDNLGNGVDFCRWGSSAQAPPAGTGWNGTNPASPAGSRNLGRDGLSTDTDNSSNFTSQPGTLGRQNLPYTSSLQTVTVGTPTIQALLTNWNNIAARGTFPTLSYKDDGVPFLYDASFFVGALKPNGDTVVYRSFFSDQQFLPAGPLAIDSVSDPRATHIRSTSITFDSVLDIQAHYLLPKSADSGEFIICHFTVENRSDDTLKNVLLGMVADYDAPPDPSVNDNYFDADRNLIWLESPFQAPKAALSGLGLPYIYYSAHARDNPTYVWPYNGYRTGELYGIANDPFYSIHTESQSNDLNVILTHQKITAFPPVGCATATFAMILNRSTLGDLWSSAQKAKVFTEDIFPSPPSTLQAVGNCLGAINLSFNPSVDPDFQYFKIYRNRRAGDSANPFLLGTTSDTSFVDSVPPSGLFFYWVSAVHSACNEGLLSPRASALAGLKGDLNADTTLSPADVVLELNAVFSIDSFPAPFCAADLDCDGSLSPADVVLELNLVFLNISAACAP